MALIVSDYQAVPEQARNASVALGNFDGVHAGHRAVIGSAADYAQAMKLPLAVLIFEPPPRRFFQPDSEPFRIMRPEKRRETLSALGVDVVFELPFNKAMSQMSPQTFVEDVLLDGLALRHLSVGFDFRFGKGREGDTTTLKSLSKEHGFSLSVLERVTDGEAKISSTAIRTALQEGRPGEASQLLGTYWTADGFIEHGEKRGRTLGFPTANLKLGNLIHPRHGIYAVWTRIEGETGWRPGVANFGRTPTTGVRDPLLEVFLFDFDGDLYDKKIEVAFVSFLRSEEKFDTLDALVVQMHRDVEAARASLKDNPAPEA